MVVHYTHESTPEFPDSTLTLEQRHHLKGLARRLAENHNVNQLMYLAGALEEQARQKRVRAS